MAKGLNLEPVAGTYAICRLETTAELPGWIPNEGLISVTRTDDELSIVCLEETVDEDVRAEPGWSCFRVSGSLDFEIVGVLSAISSSLSRAGISVFCVSTYDTDYFLVKEAEFGQALQALRDSGHCVKDCRCLAVEGEGE